MFCKNNSKAEVAAVITRKDGTVENLGIIAETQINKISIARKVKNIIGRWFKWRM